MDGQAYPTPSTLEEALSLVARQAAQIESLQHQLAWLKRQLFGPKSERRLLEIPPEQMSLGEILESENDKAPVAEQEVAAHTRRKAQNRPSEAETELFFDENVPMERIVLPNPEIEGLSEDQYEIIDERHSHRLAQRPGSYVILDYVRPVIKRKSDQTLHCPPAPQGVFEGSRADVSFVAGLLIDKFAYHLPLYRQHQRLGDAGIRVERSWLTKLVHRAAALLEPIHEAQLQSIRQSRVKAMDETPIKAGRKGKGKLGNGYFWPVYGEEGEIAFLYYPSRAARHVREALGKEAPKGAVLLSDGYSAYACYAEQTGLTHAQCWSHTRRKFIQAENAEPDGAAKALDFIGVLYKVEDQIRKLELAGEAKRRYRVEHAKPVVEIFFTWVKEAMENQGLLPSNPLTTALGYALERRLGLEVYLTDPDVPIDTNHLERALRAIPMGRKNWLFCWTEVGAKYVGFIQSLLVTCRMHGIDPYDYFVDVLQRIDHHPASEVHLLTPRLWKRHFADNPLRSPLHHLPLLT